MLADVRERVVAIMRAEGTITLARLRDELQTSRRYAQALLEHLDAQRVTRRIGDERVPGSRAPAFEDRLRARERPARRSAPVTSTA